MMRNARFLNREAFEGRCGIMNKIARIVAGLATVALVEATTVHYTSVNGVPSVTLDVAAARAEPTITANFGYRVLACYHPSARFVQARFGQPYRDANGRNAQDWQIDFKGAISGDDYVMNFTFYRQIMNKDTYVRIHITRDNAPFVPNPNCELNEWTRVD
jgi:hypothetical protein